MNQSILYLLYVSLLGMVPTLLFAQSGKEYKWNLINSLDGLSHNQVNDILEDQKGFIWFATDGGLNRYDGSTIKIYEQNPDHQESLSSNTCYNLLEDRSGNIWIGTAYGLNKLDPKTETIRPYFYESSDRFEAANYIHTTLEDPFGYIWFGTFFGTKRLNPETGEIDVFFNDPENPSSIPGDLVWKMVSDDQQNIWFGGQNELAILSYENLKNEHWEFEVYHTDPENPKNLPISGVWAIAQDSTQQMWLGGRNGLARVQRNEQNLLQFEHWTHQNDQQQSLSYDFINTLHVDPTNHLWIGTYAKGLNQVHLSPENPTSLDFIHHQHEINRPESLAANNVVSIQHDRSGTLWVGTANGLSVHDPNKPLFQHIEHLPNEPFSLNQNEISVLFEDQQENLWIGTLDGGVNVHLKNSDKALGTDFLVFKHDPLVSGSLSHNQVSCIFEDQSGYIWIGTYDGLNLIHRSEINNPGAFRHLGIEDGLPHKWVNDIYQDSDGLYWLATYGGFAQMTFDPAKSDKPISVFEYQMDESNPNSLSNATTYQIESDRFNALWIASFNGLNRFESTSQTDSARFDCYYADQNIKNSLANNLIHGLFKDQQDQLWVFSSSGLHFIDQTDPNQKAGFRVFTRKDGLPSNHISDILEDESGLFWVSTNKGIAVFDPRIALDEENPASPVLKIWGISDGLQGEQFNHKAAVKTKNGDLFFGGQHGFNRIDPKNLIRNKYTGPVVFTDFKLFNRSVDPGALDYDPSRSPLSKSISFTDSITLNYKQNDFSLSFALLNFTNPQDQQYEYKLEGFHQSWIPNAESREASFTNLNHGSYRLLVRAANNDGEWTNEPAELFIRILPPPWKTLWAYLVYGLIAVFLIASFIRFRVRQKTQKMENLAALERARIDERERIQKKNAADFHDELGHKLTKIGLFLGLARRTLPKADDQSNQYLDQTEKYVQQLSGGIRDFIWVLDPHQDALLDTFSRLQAFGDQLFDFTDIRFHSQNEVLSNDQIKLDLDQRRQIVLIFKEAMNNTLKYSQAKTARLNCSAQRDQILISFEDDGLGFDLEQAKGKGYGIRNLNMRAQKIGAKLKIDTKIGEGCRIDLSIPIPHMG